MWSAKTDQLQPSPRLLPPNQSQHGPSDAVGAEAAVSAAFPTIYQ